MSGVSSKTLYYYEIMEINKWFCCQNAALVSKVGILLR